MRLGTTLLAGVFFLSALHVCSAQSASTAPEFVPDRPDFTESSEVVGRHVVQIETGLRLEQSDDTTRQVSAPQMLVRVGLGSRVEVRLGGDGYIAQSMRTPGFTKAFADRLDKVCKIRVIESAGGEALEAGIAYIAPGGHHLVVDAHGVRLTTRLHEGPQLHHQRPAVDELFYSLARLRGVPIVAVLLTGMGADGADGMLALRKAGAETIAEDEHSCIVFGMPREAIARQAAMHVATLLRMPTLIPECFARVAGSSSAKAS